MPTGLDCKIKFQPVSDGQITSAAARNEGVEPVNGTNAFLDNYIFEIERRDGGRYWT